MTEEQMMLAQAQELISKYKELNKENIGTSKDPSVIRMIFFAKKDTSFAEFCAEPRFEKFWEAHLLSDPYCIIDEPEKIFLQPQPSVGSFKLVLGYFLFQDYYEKKDKTEKEISFKKSRECDYFSAMQSEINSRLTNLLNETSHEPLGLLISLLFNKINLVAQKHGTPGFMIGIVSSLKLYEKYSKSNDKDNAYICWCDALSYAHAAVLCIPHSQAAINNTFEPENPIGEKTIAAWFEKLSEPLSSYDQERAEITGANLANLYLNQLGKTLNLPVTRCERKPHLHY